MPGWGPALGLSPAIQRRMQRVKLSREILPYPLVDVIDLWWLYALLGVIDLWWLYGWHVGVTALLAFYGIAGFVLYTKRSQARQSQVRHEIISNNSFMGSGPVHGVTCASPDVASARDSAPTSRRSAPALPARCAGTHHRDTRREPGSRASNHPAA